MQFPQYRKYPNEASYFRIESPEVFEELKKIGERWTIERYEAKILPDRNFIHDLLHKCPDFAVCIEAEEYLKMRKRVL